MLGFENKRGLSEVVTTLIIILLVLVAIGIIWVVVSNILQTGTQQTEINAKCLQIDLRATAATCDGVSLCNVTYHRGQGGDAIDGIKIVLGNGQNSETTDVSGNVAPLDTRTASVNYTLSPGPTQAQVAAYFLDASGNEQLCGTTNTLEF